MSRNNDKYKQKPVGFTDITTGRFVRAQRQEEHRRTLREQSYARNRVIESPQSAIESPVRTSVNSRLARWKKERDLVKKMEAQNKKPVFKVGIVHHKFFSPPVSSKVVSNVKPCHGKHAHKSKATPVKRVTRATAKRLEAKAAASCSTPVASTSKKVPKSTGKRRLIAQPSTSFAPDNHSFTAPLGLPGISLFGRYPIPNATAAGSTDNDDEELKSKLEEPWPRALHPPVDIDDQSRRSSFGRRYAVRPLSPEIQSRVQLDSSDSAMETFELRLSSEGEIAGPEIPVDVEISTENDSNFASDANDNKIETPPRSGTPVPASFSPYIVTSRGKDSARKEQMVRMGIRRSCGSEIPTKENVMESMNISIEEEERTAKYFKFILEREIVRLNELCDLWETTMNEPELPEDSRCQINQAIGQTRLLMRKKFEKFRTLVKTCETGKGEMLVSCRDLQGFWDLIYMEVRDIDSRFIKLEYLKSNGWTEEQIPLKKKKIVKTAAVSKPKINAKSSARLFIAAARQKKMSEESDDNTDIVIAVNDKVSKNNTKMSDNENSRRSFKKSPEKLSPAKISINIVKPTPKRTPISLRKSVQLSEASKTVLSPLAIMKISQMCKTPEVTLDDTISYINSNQTPGKSILKKSSSSESDKSIGQRKSIRKVDFNDDVFAAEIGDNDEISDELQNSIDLGHALARIDSYDDDYNDEIPINVSVRGIEKRLNFEDPSFDETVNTNTAESAAFVAAIPESKVPPSIRIIPDTPLKSHTEESPSTSLIGKRVLRNRKIRSTSSNTDNRRSSRRSETAKENNDPMIESKESENIDSSLKMINENPTPRRRSTRKSVRFNAEDCTTCTPKAALPMTPHTRRSRNVSLLGDTRISTVPQTSDDLMSFESPVKLPARVRRSSTK